MYDEEKKDYQEKYNTKIPDMNLQKLVHFFKNTEISVEYELISNPNNIMEVQI